MVQKGALERKAHYTLISICIENGITSETQGPKCGITAQEAVSRAALAIRAG
jgi:hypothetical protein